tara:strand:- start:315 stop:713 length:399 start_codon:yes stop_codon:yes gene_type:complete
MSVKERVSTLLPYLKEIKFSENLVLVSGAFYPKWVVLEKKNLPIKMHKGEADENGRVTYHFYGENKNVDVDIVLDFFEDVINENLDRERKEDLFKKKVDELKKVFKTNTITDLENLEIEIKEEIGLIEKENE